MKPSLELNTKWLSSWVVRQSNLEIKKETLIVNKENNKKKDD